MSKNIQVSDFFVYFKTFFGIFSKTKTRSKLENKISFHVSKSVRETRCQVLKILKRTILCWK